MLFPLVVVLILCQVWVINLGYNRSREVVPVVVAWGNVRGSAVENWALNGSGWLTNLIWRKQALKMGFAVLLNDRELVPVL
jgi:hypothetical protein